nr:hypothetical protein [uncultured Cohaesibacter sp.]
MSDPIEIFRAGTHTPMGGSAMTFTTDFLDEVIKNYDPEVFDAPVVKGHPKNDEPAFGWVKELFRKGDQLFATVRDLEPQFAEAVNAGRYRKVSAAFFTAGSKSSPVPGKPYLRHIGVLGAMAPAVKGMRPLEFADSEEKKPSLIQRALNQAGIQSADHHGSRLCSFSDDDDYLLFGDDDYLCMPPKVRQALIAKENEECIEKALDQARFPTGFKQGMLAFMNGLDNEEVISFSEHGSDTVEHKGSREWFQNFISHLPPMVMFGELDLGPDLDEAPSSFDAPSGYKIDIEGEQTLREIEAIAKRDNLSFTEAFSRYTAQN